MQKFRQLKSNSQLGHSCDFTPPNGMREPPIVPFSRVSAKENIGTIIVSELKGCDSE